MATTEIYNIIADSFASSPPVMPTEVYSHCMVKWSTGNKVYMIGGIKAPAFFQAGTSILDIGTQTFSTLSDQLTVPRARAKCAIMEPEGKLVAAGGTTTGWGWTRSVEVLDLNAGVWSDAAVIPVTGDYTTVTMEGYTYLLADNGFFYHYDSANDQWDLVTEVNPFGTVPSNGDSLVAIDARAALVCQDVV